MAKERNLVRKKCPYCEREIAKSGWTMHMGSHVDKEEKDFISWNKVEGGVPVSGGKQSFRGERSGESGGEEAREKEFWEETFDE